MTTQPLPIQPGPPPRLPFPPPVHDEPSYRLPPPPGPPPRGPWRPWWRRTWVVAAAAGFAGLLFGSVAAGTSQPAGQQVDAPTVTSTATVTRTRPAVTRTVRAKPPATNPAVAAVLRAWTDYGPEPDKQRAAMERLRRDWPTLARALDRATGEEPQLVAAAPARTTTRTQPAAPPPLPAEATGQPDPPTQVYYANCAAARAAGAAPIMRGEPGYRPGLDRDSDGVACE